jgi:hypothetical protein
MFVVNQEILSAASNKPLFDWMQSKFEEIRKTGKKYIQVSTVNRPRFMKTDRGNRKINKRSSVPMTSDFFNDDFQESQTWSYIASSNLLKREGDMVSLRGSNAITFENSQQLDVERDIEIIFFLVYISGFFDKKMLFLIDKEKDSKEKAEQAALEAESRSMVYSLESVIAPERLGSDDVFHRIAALWGVIGSKEKPLFDVRHELWRSVVNNQSNKNVTLRGFKDFLKDCKSMNDSNILADVVMAVERGLLYCTDNVWKLKCRGGHEENIDIINIDENPNSRNIMLADRFNKRPYLKDFLKDVLKNGNLNEIAAQVHNEKLKEEKEAPVVIDKKISRPDLLKKVTKNAAKIDFTYQEAFKMNKNELIDRLLANNIEI